MSENQLISLAAILALGLLAQWLGWRFKLPSILPLLVFGLAAGPAAMIFLEKKLIDPDLLLHDLLFPIVSLSVGVILFEGGLSLRFSELRGIGSALSNLLVFGALVTWLLAAGAAHYLLDFAWPMALLFAALLVVTGPTVIVPLLRQVRPAGTLNSLLKWEGIVNDPIGAILAVLVLEIILAGSQHAGAVIALMVGKAVMIALVISTMLSGLLIVLLKRYWVPDYLQSPATLALVALAFVASNYFQAETGLLTVTLMGIILANQKWASVHHIITFKENLRTLLISVLFILLAARLRPEQLTQLDVGSIFFLIALIVIVRPASVFLATIGSKLSWQQKLFLALICPRGIVAAAVSSVIAIELTHHQIDASALVPNMFLVIIGTITFCALVANPAAQALGLVKTNPQGVLLVGAHKTARMIAAELANQEIETVLIDTNRHNIATARMEGLTTYHGSSLSEHALETIDLSGIKRMMALTANDQANALAALHYSEFFGRGEVYQLCGEGQDKRTTESARHLHGRFLFGPQITFWTLESLVVRGAVIKTTNITDEYTYEQFQQQYGDDIVELFVITESGDLTPMTLIDPPSRQDKCKIIFITSEPG